MSIVSQFGYEGIRIESQLKLTSRMLTRCEMEEDDELLALVTHRDRTGMKSAALLKSAPDKPSNLRAETVKAWMNGQTRSADPAMLKYVLNLYASLPDKR